MRQRVAQQNCVAQVSFWLKGQKLHSTSARGFTAVVLAVDGEVEGSPATFDTNQGSVEFEDFLDSSWPTSRAHLGAFELPKRSNHQTPNSSAIRTFQGRLYQTPSTEGWKSAWVLGLVQTLERPHAQELEVRPTSQAP